MFENLLESKSERNRSVVGAIVSGVAHTAVIAIAVVSTAHARLDEPVAPEIVRWVDPPGARPPVSAAKGERLDRSAPAKLPDLSFLERIDVVTASFDPAPALLPVGSVPLTVGSSVPGRESADGGGVPTTEALSADQVDRQVALLPGSRPPRYPDRLRLSGVEGEVVAVFVVDEGGRVELGSLRFARSDNALFEVAVRGALATLKFAPAEVGGRKVRQLVQMPFVFRLQ